MEKIDWKLEISIEEDLLELSYYLPGLHRDKGDGYGLLITKEDLTLEVLEAFINDCRQLEIDEEAKKN